MTETARKPLRRRLLWLWREWVRPLLAVVIVLGSLRSAIADWNDVPSGSMKPTILEGDRVFVNKLAYDLKIPFTTYRISEWSDPERGDVVVLFSPHDGKRLIKRVIGIPDDRVEMRKHRLVVNGVEARYAPLETAVLPDANGPGAAFLETSGGRAHAILTTPQRPSMASFTTVLVPAGKYLVMGDNRDQSFDSRWFGFVERRLIVGRATAVVFSFDIRHGFAPRWDRFFTRLP